MQISLKYLDNIPLGHHTCHQFPDNVDTPPTQVSESYPGQPMQFEEKGGDDISEISHIKQK